MTDDRSLKQIVKLGASGSVGATGPKRKPARVTLDFATWRAHLAAPGSRFELAQPASAQIVRLDTVSHAAGAPEAERHIA